MNSFQLFKATFTTPKLLPEARKKAMWKILLYILFLSVIFSIPTVKQILSLLQDFQNDGTKILTKLPDFSIKDGGIVTNKKDPGFIYQTQSMIFTFDPEGKRDDKMIESDLVGDVVGVAFLKDKFLFMLPGNGAAKAVLGSNQLELSYKDERFTGFTNKSIERIVSTNSSQVTLIKVIAFIIALYPTFISLLLNILFATIAANILSRFRRLTYRFSDNFKIIAYSATLPVIFTTVLHLFKPAFDDTYLLILFTLYVYFQATKINLPKKTVE